ncbi:MAG: hypothetical protein JWP58_366 [Hymenobacter sp.]|nr:hypothetical protein [Hymenobacter sp.]
MTYLNAPSRHWPTSPASDVPEPPFVLDLPYDHVRVFLTGVSFAHLSTVKNNNWGQQLRAVVPAERLETVWGLVEAFEAVPSEQPFALRLQLSDAADLHLAAHIGGITTAHDVWDEILQNLRRNSTQQNAPPAVQADPNARTMRQEVAMVSAELARYVEEVFGEDTPALAANRELASQLIAVM